MTIRIVRNENGNCINFVGSSNPVYFNSCLSAEVDPNDSTLVNVINDIHTAQSGQKEYEFFNIPFVEWQDRDGNSFASAQEVADYITLNGNVATGTDIAAGYEGVWDASTNTPDLTGLSPNNGDWFYVSVDGTYESVDYYVNDIIKWDDTSSVWTHIPNTNVRVDQLEQEVNEIVYTTETPLFNTNSAVYADGDPGLVDPNRLESGWYYRNESSGVGKINWYFTGAGAGAAQQITVGSLKNQFAVIKVLATGVPYFNVYTVPTGQAADAASWYRSRMTYLTSGALDSYVGQTVLLYRGDDPSNLFQTMPHIEMVLDESTSVGPAGTDELVMFGSLSTSSGQPEGTYEFIAKSLGFTNSTAVTQFNLDTNDPVAAIESTDIQANTQIDFTRDATNTSVILSHDGSHYGVNTIKAVAEADGTISINGIGDNGEPLVTSIQYDQITIAGLSYTTRTAAVNALNALFTVNPYGVGYEPAVILPVTGDLTTTLNFAEGQTPITGDPVHLYTTGSDTSTGHGARAWTNQVINQAGEYFDVKVTGGNGRFILGLVDADNATYMSELSNDSGNGNSGLTWGNAFYDYGSYTAPWTWYGNDSAALGLSYGAGWNGSSDKMMRYNQEVQDNLDNMEPVLFRVGINDQGYIYVSYYDAGRTNSFIITARTGKVVSAGNYALVVKLWSGNTTLVEASTVSLLADSAAPPTALGDENITIFGEGVTGTLAGGITSSATDGLDNDGFVSQQAISSVGEYFQFNWSAGEDWNFGLFSENDNTVAAMAADTSSWGNDDYIFYGARAQDGGGIDNRYSESALAFDNLNATVAGQYYGRVGFDSQGRPTVWQSSDGITWDIRHRGRSAAPNGNYRFIAVAQNDGASFTSLQQGVLSTAPTLAFRYIESPDGYYSYPLFATAEEADYYELTESGVDNGSHTHVYPDDPTAATWYMPSTQFQMNYELTPVEDGNTTFQGNAITWTEIPSQTNADLAPPAFTGSDFTFDENESVNIQVSPAGASWTTSVAGLPEGLTFDGGSLIQGTTRYVYGDQEYTVTVTRTNSYGSSQGTFTLTITDDVSQNVISGMTIYGQNPITQSPDTVHHYSGAVNLDVDLSLDAGTEIIWTQQNDTPVGGVGQYMQIGIADVGVDKATTQLGNNTQDWQVSATIWTGTLNHQWANGWTDSSDTTYAESNDNVEWKIAFPTDNGPIELYRAGVLVRTSSANFSGSQTLTVGVPVNYNKTTRMPSFVRADIGAGSTTPPTGFTSPVESGAMASTSLFGNGGDGAVFLTETLKVNHRYVVPRAWIEANVLPNIAGGGVGSGSEKFFFGVPKDSAEWSSIGLTEDFHAVFRLEGGSSSHSSRIVTRGNGGNTDNEVNVGSATSAFYDYAIEWDGVDLHVIACNINDINIQPSVSNGGAFSRVGTIPGFATNHGKANQELSIVIAVKDSGSVTLSTSGLQQIRIPFSARTVLAGEHSSGHGTYGIVDATEFDLGGQHAPTSTSFSGITSLDAGQTYKFIYHPSMEADDYIEFRLASDGTTVYSTGITAFDNTTDGDPSYSGTQGYKGITFAVPADAPPLRLYHYNEYQSGSFDSGRPITIAGSTYVEPVTGITAEGPSANQTGTNLFDTDDHGWYSIDEKLGAGERLVFSNAFLVDFVDAMPDNTLVSFGPKDTDWSSGSEANSHFLGGLRFTLVRYSSADIHIYLYTAVDNVQSSSYVFYTNVADLAADGMDAFIEVTSSGNNVRGGFGTTDSATGTAYADWDSRYKKQTGDRGYGITEIDIMIQGMDISGSGVTNPGMDSADVDWTGLAEVSIPQPAVTMTTPWTKALDFSGSNEHALQVSPSSSANAVRMQGLGYLVPANSDPSKTSDSSYSRPWATAIVFQSDRNSSNQHIWNSGEGASSNDDNIYIRLDANGNLYFGWGRTGALNECRFGGVPHYATGRYWGVYVAHNGTRLSGSNATAANLAACFDIRLMTNTSDDNFATLGSNLSTAANWTAGSTGGRMDRSVTGTFTVGGRGSNRNFHGKVASMVITHLKINSDMPTDAEVKLMITDPKRWEDDYRVGQTVRQSYGITEATYSPSNLYNGYGNTQIWLMGDGTSDSYSNMIRNEVFPSDQNYTKLDLVSMVSNDIQNVSILGLS